MCIYRDSWRACLLLRNRHYYNKKTLFFMNGEWVNGCSDIKFIRRHKTETDVRKNKSDQINIIAVLPIAFKNK